MMLETHIKLCMTEPHFFDKKKHPPKMVQNESKIWCFEAIETFFYHLFFKKKIWYVYFVCFILVQIPYLEKIWLLKYGPKCFQPIRLQDF